MKSPKTLALVFLALTTIGGAVLGWKQYQELVELRAAALNKDERADLQKRIWELEKLNREMQDQLASQDDNPDDMLAAANGDPAAQNRGGNRGNRGNRGNNNGQQTANALRALMSKPEVQALLSVQQKAMIDARYAALFKSMNLSPDQKAKVESLLSDRMSTMQDVMAAARDQGIDPRRDPQAFQKLMADAQNDFNNSLKSVLGDSGFNQFQNYEQTMPQRNLVNQLQQRLSYSDTPLSQAQADQLVNILAQNPAPRPTNPDGTPIQGGRRGGQTAQTAGGGQVAQTGGGFGGGFGGGPGGMGGLGAVIGGFGGGDLGGGGGGRGGGGTATVTPAAVNQAQGVLSQPQVTALQQIQQQQQTQQQLQQIVRDTLAATQTNNNRNGTTTTGTNTTGGTTTTTGTAGGGRKRGGGGG